MSRTPNPDPHLECHLHRDSTQSTIPRESTVTPVEHPLILAQAQNLQLLSQEPVNKVVEEPTPEEGKHTLESYDEHMDCPLNTPQNPHPNTSGLDLQAILMALARQPDLQPKKRTKGVKEPDLFSGGSPDELRAFIF